ncbi:MAG: hypothetical protein Ta2E_09130 [Mycoplasmoidaceae bacterium]|nr:MAG: hypothetical protein Ta2E_09130 [Mycoplasmoidaceae bacterium]
MENNNRNDKITIKLNFEEDKEKMQFQLEKENWKMAWDIISYKITWTKQWKWIKEADKETERELLQFLLPCALKVAIGTNDTYIYKGAKKELYEEKITTFEIEILRAQFKYIQNRKDFKGVQLHLNFAEKEDTDNQRQNDAVYLNLKKVCDENDVNKFVRKKKEEANDLSKRIINCKQDLKKVADLYFEKNYEESYNKGLILWNEYKLIKKKEFRELIMSILFNTIDSMLNTTVKTMETAALLGELNSINKNGFDTRYLNIKLAILENQEDLTLMPMVEETYIFVLRKYNPLNFANAEELTKLEERRQLRADKTGNT